MSKAIKFHYAIGTLVISIVCLLARWYKPANAWINHFYFKELVDVAGCTNKNACNYNPAATQNDGSCDTYSCVDHSHKVTDAPPPSGAIAGGVSIAVISVIAVAGLALFVIVRTKNRNRRDGGLANNLGPDDNDSKARLDHPTFPKHKYIECFFIWVFHTTLRFLFRFWYAVLFVTIAVNVCSTYSTSTYKAPKLLDEDFSNVEWNVETGAAGQSFDDDI